MTSLAAVPYSGMKNLLALGCVILGVALSSCATKSVVGPKPNTAPVAASNAATRASIIKTRAKIKATRDSLKEAQAHEAKGATALEKADDLLTKMLKK